MDEALDIFRGDGFTAATVDRIVRNATFVPQALGAMGIFTPTPIRTRGIEVFKDNVTMRLIPTTEIGAPDIEQLRDQGDIKYLRTVRIAKKDRVQASELQDIIANWQRGDASGALRDAYTLITERAGKLKGEAEMTFEYHRLGALQGNLVDADGSTVLYNYYTQLGVTQPGTVSVDFAGLAAEQFILYFQDNFQRPILRSLKDRKQPNTGIAALCGDAFWAKLMSHPGWYQVWLRAQESRMLAAAANPLLVSNAWNEVEFAGIRWINYMGTDDGTTIAIPTRDAIFFPTNATDVFRQYQGPGETLQDANTMGKPWYMYVVPDPRVQMQEFIDARVRSYPLFACIFPQALMRATIANGQ